MASQVKIRVQLIDLSGNDLAAATEISLKAEDTIYCFLGQVKIQYPAQLWCLEPNQLRAFCNVAAWKGKDHPIRARDRVNIVLLPRGRSKDGKIKEVEPIEVLVPINSPSEKWPTALLATSIWSLPDLDDLSLYIYQELP